MKNEMSDDFISCVNRIIGAKLGIGIIARESEPLEFESISDDVAIGIQGSTVVDAITLGLNHENTRDLFFLFNATTEDEILYIIHKNSPIFNSWIHMIRRSDSIISPRKAAK